MSTKQENKPKKLSKDHYLALKKSDEPLHNMKAALIKQKDLIKEPKKDD